MNEVGVAGTPATPTLPLDDFSPAHDLSVESPLGYRTTATRTARVVRPVESETRRK